MVQFGNPACCHAATLSSFNLKSVFMSLLFCIGLDLSARLFGCHDDVHSIHSHVPPMDVFTWVQTTQQFESTLKVQSWRLMLPLGCGQKGIATKAG